MNIKLYFNFILLGLCLTTLLITLITYIIFRLRYSLKAKTESKAHRLEGQFFRRYAPHLKKINEELVGSFQANVKKVLSFKMKIIYAGGLTFAFVMTVLVAENYLVFRKELSKRAENANVFRKLLDEGLLKTYDYNPRKNILIKEEIIPEASLKQLSLLLQRVREKNIIIFTNEENQKNTIGHKKSVDSWMAFCKNHGIKYNLKTRIYNADTAKLWVFPKYERVLESEKKAFDKALSNNGHMILTGLFGVYNLTEAKTDFTYFNELTDLKVEKNTEITRSLATTFVSKEAPLWNLPPGLMFSIPSNTPNYSFFSLQGNVKAYASSYNGVLVHKNGLYGARYKVVKNKKNIIWLDFDPLKEEQINFLKNEKTRDYYNDLIFFSTINWLTSTPVVKIANWKNGKEFVSAISVDAESKFENIEDMIKNIKKVKFPITIFTVSDLYKKFPKALEGLDPQIDEVSSHSEDHLTMTDFDVYQNFKKLQNSRLDIEQIFQNEVKGYRPPKEIYDVDSLSAVIQNKFQYIFADQSFYRYSPLSINENLMFIPRVVNDDFLLSENRLLSTPELITKAMLSDVGKVKNFGGGYFLSLHTHVFGEEEFYQKSLNSFYKELASMDGWFTTFSAVANWWQLRQNVTIHVKEVDGGNLILSIHNYNDVEVDGLVAELSIEPLLNKRGLAHVDANDGLYKITIPTIKAKELVELSVNLSEIQN